MGKTLGLLLPGQSPWPQAAAALGAFLAPDVDLVQAGALDGRSREELVALRPADPFGSLRVRLRDGSFAQVDAHLLAPRLQAALEKLQRWGADAVVLLTCAQLPPLQSRCLLVEPWRALPPLVAGLLPRGRLALVLPRHAPGASYRRKWEAVADRAVFLEADPFAPGENWGSLARQMEGASLVVLDSMGFLREAKEELQRVQRAPVLLPLSWVGSLAAQLL